MLVPLLGSRRKLSVESGGDSEVALVVTDTLLEGGLYNKIQDSYTVDKL